MTPPKLDAGAMQADPNELLHLVDWPSMWNRDVEPEWLAEPLLPKGRSIAFVAAGKSGKSLLLLDLAVSVATGRPILGQPNPNPPRAVLYVDYEMTAADVHERLDDMGYGPDHDLSLLHYSILPAIEPLDTEAGGRSILQAALRLRADLVVIDTLARAVAGPEDSADTIRAFYTSTAALLKQQNTTLVRADHVGHTEKERGRGSSAKGDDVDVVWAMRRTDDGLMLKRTHSRVPWGPTEVAVRIDNDPLRHLIKTVPAWPEGTKAIADRLDALGVPLDASKRDAVTRLQEGGGKGGRAAVVTAALKYRRIEAQRLADRFPDSGTAREPPSNAAREPLRERGGTTIPESGGDQRTHGREPLREPPGTTSPAEREPVGFPEREPLVPTGHPETGACRSCAGQKPTAELDAGGCCAPCRQGHRRAGRAALPVTAHTEHTGLHPNPTP